MFKHLKETLMLRAFGIRHCAMLLYLAPRVLDFDENQCEIMIPLGIKTKNHLGSMYFGALAAGADCAGGLIAVNQIEKSGKKIEFSFKNFQADFLKKAMADTHFKNEEGVAIKEFINNAANHPGERFEMPLHITATCPKDLGNEPVAEFVLTLSVKLKDS